MCYIYVDFFPESNFLISNEKIMIIMIIITICFALFILRTALIFFINLFINQGMVLRVNLSLALFSLYIFLL